MEIDMENTMKKLGILLKCICFAVCFALVIIGHRTIGYAGLGTMLTGMVGILVLLYIYNKKYK